MKYLREHREALGGYVPQRVAEAQPLQIPDISEYEEFLKGSDGRAISTTMGFVRMLSKLLKDKQIGKRIVPIVPDESRTFGMDGLFRQIGIYAHEGQKYEPVDSETVLYYREAQDGQILEEGITEAGSMSSFIAAGTSHVTVGQYMIPIFIYYSMFGFQRIGDLIWAACDSRARGFMLGGTAGRTTLAGEGLQHQDGHSLLNAIAFPNVRAYDPAFAYETAIIVLHGMKVMYEQGEDCIYYLTLENDNYPMPAMPKGVEDGVIKGMYLYQSRDVDSAKARVQLFGSGAIMNQVLAAQDILAEQYGIASDIWSVTSYTELRRDAQTCARWNRLHPAEAPKQSYFEKQMDGREGPVIAASDYVCALPEQLMQWCPGGMTVLGTDGFGRSEAREDLRRHFEVDAQCITAATLHRLSKDGHFSADDVAKAIGDMGIDPEKINPLYA